MRPRIRIVVEACSEDEKVRRRYIFTDVADRSLDGLKRHISENTPFALSLFCLDSSKTTVDVEDDYGDGVWTVVRRLKGPLIPDALFNPYPKSYSYDPSAAPQGQEKDTFIDREIERLIVGQVLVGAEAETPVHLTQYGVCRASVAHVLRQLAATKRREAVEFDSLAEMAHKLPVGGPEEQALWNLINRNRSSS